MLVDQCKVTNILTVNKINFRLEKQASFIIFRYVQFFFSMEDAELTKLNFAQDLHLFAVFDGHGGREVS